MAKRTGTRKGAKTSGTPSQGKGKRASDEKGAAKDSGLPGLRTARSGQEGGPERFPIVGLGASAGGLEAFTSFLKALPPDSGMGFVLIQHMDPTHESILANLLQRSTKMPVRDAADGTVVEPNHIYILPPNKLITIAKGVLSLTSRSPRSYKDYPIDQFFVSLADDLKNKAIGVVLSGTATDGTRGLLAIKAEGGITFAQDTETAQFSSMPASAVASGCVDFTLPPDQIAQELARINHHPYLQRPPVPEPRAQPSRVSGLGKILRQLRLTTGVDFELYKPAMIARRVARRMTLQKVETFDEYLEIIGKDRTELNALYEDIFIHVTGFFRDPESLNELQKHVLANLQPGKTFGSIRIWVPGCSSGEEVYSIAMLLFETLGERRTETTIQIFGTDISERSVQRARAGIYPASSMVDVSPERQRRFFARQDSNFQISKAIRDVCVFARHDLSKDPPFSRMDLISCRNVLIYMGPTLQKKVIEAFHYALKPGGYLLLGKSESLSAYSSLFGTDDSRHKILVRRPLESPLHVHSRVTARAAERLPPPRNGPPVSDARRDAERLLLDQYAPPALVVDWSLQIIHFSGDTGRFLAPSSGEPSFHLLRMIRPELLVDMRMAMYQAKKEGRTVNKEAIRFKHNGESSLLDISVSPMKARHGKEIDYLVVFRETAKPEPAPKPTKASAAEAKDQAKAELARRERELANLREQLQDLVQDHEAADEEVRSMNEEILSSNEELQSTNEELETAKEELESTNEELTTLNDELQTRNSDLTQMTDDLSNVLVAVDIPIIILDDEMRIRRFTPAVNNVLNLIATDIGRPLFDIAPTLTPLSWKELTSEMMKENRPTEREAQDRDGRWYAVRVRPYRSGNRVGGVLIALIDIDNVKRTLEEASAARQRAEDLEARFALAGEGLRIGMWEYDVASGVIRGTKQWSHLFGLPPGVAVSREEWLSRIHPEDRTQTRADIDELITLGTNTDREYRVVLPDGSTHWLNRRAELVRDDHGNPQRIRGISIDIGDQKTVEHERQAFAARVSGAQEAERRRIARELHDGLIQELGGMAMDLGRRATDAPRDLKKDYRALQQRVIKAAEAARHLAYELHPTELDDLGLENALRAYCEQFSSDNGIHVDFTASKTPNVSREVASALYKVAQEGLRNAAKHSKTKRAKVILDTKDSTVRLRVEDSGAGFNIKSLPASAGLGIASMRERVELVNGKFMVRSEPGKGTQVGVEIPLNGVAAEGKEAV